MSDNKNEPVEVPLHFRCPISMCLMLDPITLPCGHSYSRQSLEAAFMNRRVCPFCQADLTNFNVTTAPRAISLQEAIDAFIAEHNGNISDLIPDKISIILPVWKASIKRVRQKGSNLTKIGQLKITNINDKFKFKTLLMIVVDESGSMGGNPINQVKFSLKRIVDSAYDNPTVLCQVIGYDDTAQSFFIDISQTKETNYDRVEKIGRMGGTNFKSAFSKIVEIMNSMKQSPVNNLSEISNLIIIFMTDGQDSTTGDARMQLVDKLSEDIRSIWDKQFTVHTVGFGQGHDFGFLQRLTLAGNSGTGAGAGAGAYRFADPMEDNDSLSVKIGSIIRTVMNNSDMAPIELLDQSDAKIENVVFVSPKIIHGSNGNYWVDITGYDDDSQKCLYTVRMKGVPDALVNVEFETKKDPKILEPDNDSDKKIEYAWYSYLIDRIAEELYALNATTVGKNDMPLDRQIHLELLNQRSKSLGHRLESDSDEYKRLQGLTETLTRLRGGEAVDQKKLADAKAEGQYKTVGAKKNQATIVVTTQYTPVNYHISEEKHLTKPWDVIDLTRIKRIDRKNINDNYREVINMFTNKKHDECMSWLQKSTDIANIVDAQGSNLLMMMCAIGRLKIVKRLLDLNVFDVNTKNNAGYCCLDYATMFGFWKIYDHLKDRTIKHPHNDCYYRQFRTCITNAEINLEKKNKKTKEIIEIKVNKFYNIASRLVKDKKVIIDDEIINQCSTKKGAQWLMSHSNLDMSMEQSIIKGIYDVVEEKIQKGFNEKLDWSTFDKIIRNTKIELEQVQIFELLFQHKILDPDQIYEIPNPTIDLKEDDEKTEITWPLFVVCEKGDMNMFNLLIKYCSKEAISRQNKKGGYCLWIASCNKHVDIVSCLLSKNADPNMTNAKGENSIVPACQKSAVSVVELLLVAGARLDLYDKKRDNPILLTCRIGQHVILEMFLQRYNLEELEDIHNQYAEVDGFNPLLASTELDRIECIKVLYRYRANLEWKTSDTNPIIPGATALHLACFYDRLDSLKLLLEFGANIRATTNVGAYNCMHIAIRRGHMRIVDYLMTQTDTEIRDYLLNERDSEQRVPGYYAQISGNEEIYQEYFCNRLGMYLENLLYAPDEIAMKCTDRLIKYGESPGVYEYKNFIDTDVRGMNIASLAVINHSDRLLDALTKMKCDMSKADEYGVSAEFWSALALESKHSHCYSDPNIGLMLKRLDDMRTRSIQNKLLLTAPTKAPLFLDRNQLITNNQITPLLKMNDGYNQNVEASVLGLLRRSGGMEQSLLGFVDKLKSGKNFPDGKDCLEYMMWESKLHMIRLIASGEQYLNPTQILALYLYSTNKTIFEQVNLILVKWNNASSSLWHPFVLTIYQALQSLPVYEGEVYRVVDYKFDPKIYSIGIEVIWSTLSSCSKEFSQCLDAIKQNKGIIFIILSKTGRDINRYSKTPADQDVMFLPGSKFKITNYYQANQITLAQANIRNVTFKIREKDIQNAIEGKAIIVELQEI
jgi:ankyrin repeat protein/uncharacterized protein YegL